MGATDDDTLVGIVGRLTEVKNHALFLEAAARYKERFGPRASPNDAGGSGALNGGRVRFVVIGDGHLRGELEARARALGLADDVEFTGLRDDPENFYPALDVVALTSLNEGTPLTLIEAMANARAVVATSVGGVVDLLGEPDGPAAAAGGGGEGEDDFSRRGWQVRERGVLVRPRDAEAFRDGLARVAADAELRRSLGERGRRFVEGRYSVTRLVADVGRLYEELARGARAGTTSAGGGAAEKPQELGRAAARLKGE